MKSWLYILPLIACTVFFPASSFAEPTLSVGHSYANPVIDSGAYSIYYTNSGDTVAQNITVQILSVEENTFEIEQEGQYSSSLEPEEHDEVLFMLYPKQLGDAEFYYIIEWEDEVGNKYSTDNLEEPVIFSTISVAPPKVTALGLTQEQSIFVAIGVLVAGVALVIFLKKSKKTGN